MSLRARRFSALLVLTFMLSLLAACGGDSNDGSSVSWIPGTPPPDGAPEATLPPPTEEGAVETDPTEEPANPTEAPADATEEPAADPTEAPAGEPTQAPDPGVTGTVLSPEQLDQYKPNELGMIPIIEYHVFTTDPEKVEQFVRTYDQFREDLTWLYENNFYVVPLRDVILNQVSAPAGKHPVALTFDDSTVGQFRFLVGDDGGLTVDPESAVGVMEAFYAEHPDFGRGGFFAALPYACFNWQGERTEEDQMDLCPQKVTFLLDNGYEIGNHTVNHADLSDTDNETFVSELGGAFDYWQGLDPRATGDILAMPFGIYPTAGKHDDQRDMLYSGFSWDGKDYRLIGSLMVGANPAPAAVSIEWDAVWIPRIQACDCSEIGGGGLTDTWIPFFEGDPELLYTSDGNPDTITIPNELPPSLDGTLDESKLGDRELIRY